jgi:hypothetical protein
LLSVGSAPASSRSPHRLLLTNRYPARFSPAFALAGSRHGGRALFRFYDFLDWKSVPVST